MREKQSDSLASKKPARAGLSALTLFLLLASDFVFIFSLGSTPSVALASPPVPPCDKTYGSSANRTAIE